MAAAVVELDSLSDAIGAAAQDHDLLSRGRLGLALRFIAGVKIRRETLEFGGARVDAIEHRGDAHFLSPRAHGERTRAPSSRQEVVGEAAALGGSQLFPRDPVER